MIPKSSYLKKPSIFLNGLAILTTMFLFTACSTEEAPPINPDGDSVPDAEIPNPPEEEDFNADVNQDGVLNILMLGPSRSIKSGVSAFSLAQVSEELNAILSEDSEITVPVNIDYEDTYMSKALSVALGSSGNPFDYTFAAHSLLQYYYWPEGQDDRMALLKGDGERDWDYVVVASDPYIISKTPGFYALGVNKIAAKVAEGNAKTLVLMVWPENEQNTTTITNFEEFVYRTAANAQEDIEVVPAGLAWDGLSNALQDDHSEHPTPNGAYLAAASLYAQLYNRNPSSSDYTYNDGLADAALQTVSTAKNTSHYSGDFNHNSPFQGGNVATATIRFNHTGTSSENGIIGGLRWVINKVDGTELVRDGAPTVDFNLGRANTNFEANKRYKVDASKFDYSIGFPMQDGSATGNTTMLYGIDKRGFESENGTDLGVAFYMIRENELPTARAVPIRTLYARMKELGLTDSAYRDNWHMSRDLDRASGAFIYTLLTGKCDLGEEPSDKSSSAWRSWRSHKVGYETAWTLSRLEGRVPECD